MKSTWEDAYARALKPLKRPPSLRIPDNHHSMNQFLGDSQLPPALPKEEIPLSSRPPLKAFRERDKFTPITTSRGYAHTYDRVQALARA